MPRVLILLTRTSYRAEAFMAAARRLELEVTVGSDHRQALADLAPGSTLVVGLHDPEPAVARVVEFHAAYPTAAVVAAEDEFAFLAAVASEELRLPNHPPDAVRLCRNKALMRERLAAGGFPGPEFRTFSVGVDPWAAANDVAYPCVLKPLSLSASRGVIRADAPDGFVAAWERIRAILDEGETAPGGGESADEVLVESYLPGREVALEGILVHGALRTLAILDKPDPMEGPYFEETILVAPSRLPDAVQEAVEATAARAAGILGLEHGPVHAELRLDGDAVHLLEIAPRSIGGRCSRVLRFEPEATLEELILRNALGRPIEAFEREERAAGVMMLPIPGRGTLRGVAGADDALAVPGIEGLEITIPVGHRVVPLPEGHRYLGFLFASAETPEAVEAALREAHATLEIDIEPI